MLRFSILIWPLFFFAEPYLAQRKENAAYQQIRNQYAQMEPGDPAAFPYINLVLSLAKKEKNYAELAAGYRDALNFHKSIYDQLLYADSAIAAAHRSCDNGVIANAYMGRGIVHYSGLKDYQRALEDYLMAVDYVRNDEDPYLQYKLLYHFGVVKSYTGLHQDAAVNLEACADFFRKELQKEQPPNLLHNLRKGYYNSLHQLVTCYQQTGRDDKAARMIALAEKEIPDGPAFAVVRSCFLKARGISEYRKGNSKASIYALNLALPELIRTGDFASVSVIYYYQGKNALALKRKEEAVSLFKKVDSVFQHHHFIFPELQHAYHYLIRDADKRRDSRDVSYYYEALRAAETVNHEDRHHLFARMRDAQHTDEKRSAENRFAVTLIALITVSVGAAAFTLEKLGKKNERSLSDASAGDEAGTAKYEEQQTSEPKWKLAADTREKIRRNLQKFEEDKAFLEPKVNLRKVARRVGTNANYLSTYLNTEKGVRFHRYLSELRISYIAAQLAEDPETLKKNTQELALLCGILSASNFLHLFAEIYGQPLSLYRERCQRKFEN